MAMRDDERGFTLLELLITMVIMGLIITPIASAIVLGLRTETDVQARLAQSNSATLFQSYFGPDVQQSVAVGIGVGESSACGTVSPATVNMLLTWIPGQSSVSYFVDPASPKVLRRRECAGGAVVGPVAGAPVIRNLDGAPVFGCPLAGDCTAPSWQIVKATLAQRVGTNTLTSTIQATRRIS